MSYQTSSKRSPSFWLLIGARKTQVFWHQSEARTAATVWNRGCSERSLLFRNNDELRVARLRTQEFATRQTWSFQNWLSFERTLSNLNSSQRKPIHEQLFWFSDRQKILAFKMVKTNKSVLKDILRQVPLLAAITINCTTDLTK